MKLSVLRSTSKYFCVFLAFVAVIQLNLFALLIVVEKFEWQDVHYEGDDVVVISPPVMEDALPHLRGVKSIDPSFWMSHNRRTNVSFTFALSTVKRQKGSYLTKTLEALFANMAETESKDCLVIVMIAEPFNVTAVQNISAEIIAKFSKQLNSGLLEVIVPPASFYPDMTNLPRTYSDSQDRVYWRTKQNLDYAYLMMFARSRSKYYIQLEDDVLALPNYLHAVRKKVSQKESGDWYYMSFCKNGFIAKLFRSSDLPVLIHNLLSFHKIKPCDLILFDVVGSMICPNSQTSSCRVLEFRPMFTHIGEHSSLAGKKQLLGC